MRIGRLFLGLSRTNETAFRSFVIASWSYETGYWRWHVRWKTPSRFLILPRFGPSYASGTRYRVGHHFGCWIQLPFLGSLAFVTQPRFREMERWSTCRSQATGDI